MISYSNWQMEKKKINDEIKEIIDELLERLGKRKCEYRSLKVLEQWCYSITFSKYNGVVFDWSIIVLSKKLDFINVKTNLNYSTEKKNDEYKLKDSNASSILGVVIEDEALATRTIYSNTFNLDSIPRAKSFSIDVVSNTLTIFWKNIDERIITFFGLASLWPGMILKLQDFWCCSSESIQALLQLVSNGNGYAKASRLMFSKIEFTKLDMKWLLENNLEFIDVFLKVANELYELKFEENTISELMIKEGIRNRIILNDRMKTNTELCKFFLKYSYWYFLYYDRR